jgi:uncharacterized protein YpbB
MSLTYNPSAPTTVPEEVMNALPPDPDIVRLERQREDLFKTIQKKHGFLNRARGTEIGKTYQKLNAQLNNKRIRRYEQVKKKYREDYFVRIHDEAMQRHLNKTATEAYVEPVVQHELPERTQLQQVLCDFRTDLSTEDIVRR